VWSILVTGGAGFIGANSVHFLIAETPVQVIDLDNLTYAGNLETLAPLRGQARHVFRPRRPRFAETAPYAPNSSYAASKAAADPPGASLAPHLWGLPVLLTNCSNNYGPYQFPEKLIAAGDPEGDAGRADSDLRGWRQCAGLAVCYG